MGPSLSSFRRSLAAAALLLPLAALPWSCSGTPEPAEGESVQPARQDPARRPPLKPASGKPVSGEPASGKEAPGKQASRAIAGAEVAKAKAAPSAESPPPAPPAPPSAKPPAAVDKGTASASRLREEEIKEYLKRLSSSPEEAGEAFRELWEVPKDLIPQLILEVTNKDPSALKELQILVLEKRGIVRLGEEEGELHYVIPGMCNFEVDQVAAGPAKSGNGLKVILRNKKGFPLGVVVRAALVNRFRSADHPALDDRADCLGWWQSFYDRMASRL
jgi:hypothetical protein